MNIRNSLYQKILATYVLALVAVLFLFYPWKVISVTYRKCNSNDPNDILSLKRTSDSLIIFQNGDLYLKTETVYAAIVMVVGIKRIEWDRYLVEKIISEQKELAGKLPLKGDHWYLRVKSTDSSRLDWP